DNLTYREAKDGTWTVDLPPHLRLGATSEPETTAAPKLSQGRRRNLTEAYRRAVAVTHGSMRFLGLADSRPRKTAQVQELFVPLRVQADLSTRK
ncbi:MAG: hypothetical protein KDD47_16150, partial [Acidobacteria bacterium]|nr:hypothetical protein [Acidobacteriota bacterium]